MGMRGMVFGPKKAVSGGISTKAQYVVRLLRTVPPDKNKTLPLEEAWYSQSCVPF